MGQVYEDIACTSGETMKELLQRLEQGRIYRVTKCQKQESVISRGLSFRLDEELDVYFGYYQSVVPQSYESFINETMKDGSLSVFSQAGRLFRGVGVCQCTGFRAGSPGARL